MMKEWHARKPKTRGLKIVFYNTDRKVKSITKRIFISVIMHPNFMHFPQKTSFKSALESFASVDGHLRTALSRIPSINCN